MAAWRILLFMLGILLYANMCVTQEAENSGPSCPPSYLITPCTCYMEFVANLHCKDIFEQETVTRVLEESSDYQYRGFDLNTSSIMYIPASIFDIKKLSRIQVTHSTLVSLFDQTPSHANELEYLALFNVKLSRGIEWEMFSEFGNLTQLMFMNISIHKLDKSFVNHAPKSLQMLVLYNCSVSKLDDFAFASLMNLKEIHIEFGTIKELKRSMFPTPTLLDYFDFKGHKIEHLPENIFSDMPHLGRILLSDNLLATFDVNVFGSVYPNLQFIQVEDNPIVCRCHMKWITTVFPTFKWFSIDGNCSGPRELEGRLLKSLKPEDFDHCE